MHSPVDPISGYNASGPRYKVRIRSIAHNNMYLPIQMLDIPLIQKIIDGVSPLSVFGCSTIEEARRLFFRIRKKFDFSYWAATDFKVRNISDPHMIVPLRLNNYQHYLADTLIRNSIDSRSQQYLIIKSIPRCGLSTFVQAYMLWLKTFQPENSITCAPDESIMEDMKADANRLLKLQRSLNGISMNDFGTDAFFHSFHNPQKLDGISAAYIHLADMSKWYDHSTETTAYIFSHSLKQWKRGESSIFIMEGDKPTDSTFRIEDYQKYYIPQSIRLMQISDHCKNPIFVEKIILANDQRIKSDYIYIDLDKASASLSP